MPSFIHSFIIIRCRLEGLVFMGSRVGCIMGGACRAHGFEASWRAVAWMSRAPYTACRHVHTRAYLSKEPAWWCVCVCCLHVQAYFIKGPERVFNLRTDSLAMIMSLANIAAGATVSVGASAALQDYRMSQ